MSRVERGRHCELLEREAEVARLEALIEDARAGAGSLLLVRGAAGVGKSRLLEEAAVRATAAGMTVLTARGGELERDFGWGVVSQLFDRPHAATKGRQRESLLAGAARHAAPVLGLQKAEESAATDASFLATHGLYWFCVNLASQRPLLIAVDDVHWADASSLRWLAYLGRRLDGLAVLVALAARPAEPDSEEPLLARIASAPGVDVLHPRPLSRPAVAQLVRARLSEVADEEFCAACHHATGGNPFLVHEVLIALARKRIEPTAAQARRVEELGADAISRGILARLQTLPEASTRLAEAVSLLGANAEFRHAAALAELDATTAGEAADALAAVDVIRVRRPLEFVHPIVAAAIYGNISPSRRALAHRRAAQLLADDGASPDDVAGQLVHSEPLSDPWVVDVLRAAAASAIERGAPDAAVGYLRRARIEPPRHELRPIVLRELGSAELRAGEFTDHETAVRAPAAAHLQEALELTVDSWKRAAIGLELGEALWALQRHADAVAAFDRAIADAAGTAAEFALLLEARLLAAALLDVSTTPLALGRMSDVGETGGTSAAERALLGVRALAKLLEGKSADVVAALGDRALAGKERREEQASPGALMHAAHALTCADRIDDAERFYSQTIADARARSAVRPLTVALCWRSHLLFRRGALAEAEADAREALDIASALDWSDDLPASRAFLADALAGRGDVSTARDLLQPDIPAEEMPDYIGWNYLLYSRGCVRAALGDARHGLDDLLACGHRQARWQTSNPAVIPWRSAAAVLYARLEEPEEAQRLADEEVRSAQVFAAGRALGVALRAAGLVAGGEKRVELLREAVDVLERSPAQLELARALTDLGAALRREGQRTAAREPLRRGLDLAHRCGAAPLAEQARTELLATGARPRRLVLSGLDSLTASERRVAQLAAEGRANREIAQALFVTQRTIETHLSHVYRKLGIATRSDLAHALRREVPEAPIFTKGTS
jgi:DNA-binding CsgD family transcriptional regulator